MDTNKTQLGYANLFYLNNHLDDILPGQKDQQMQMDTKQGNARKFYGMEVPSWINRYNMQNEQPK